MYLLQVLHLFLWNLTLLLTGGPSIKQLTLGLASLGMNFSFRYVYYNIYRSDSMETVDACICG